MDKQYRKKHPYLEREIGQYDKYKKIKSNNKIFVSNWVA